MRALSTLLAGGILALAALALQPGCSSSPRTGDVAPNVTFVGMDGERFDLTSLRGRTVLLNFWFYH
ncbi:MAG: peroxiredoxin family protein [Planctomycetota bacterium]|jgi:cytochrome oxidase Cu insertion factor (SCO1/SenC/PrrC family)